MMPTTQSTVIARIGDARAEEVDTAADGPHREAGAGLDHESDHGAQAGEVVEQADEREEHREAEHDEQLAPSRDRRPHERRDHDRERERGDDREATEVRHRVGVALVPTREIEHVAPRSAKRNTSGVSSSENAADTRKTARYCQPPPVTTSDSTGSVACGWGSPQPSPAEGIRRRCRCSNGSTHTLSVLRGLKRRPTRTIEIVVVDGGFGGRKRRQSREEPTGHHVIAEVGEQWWTGATWFGSRTTRRARRR